MIILEGTGRVGYLVPLLVGVAVAVRVGDAINGASFYEEQLRAKGVPYLRPATRARPFARARWPRGWSPPISRVDPRVFGAERDRRRVEAVLRTTAHNGFPMVIPDDGETDREGVREGSSASRFDRN